MGKNYEKLYKQLEKEKNPEKALKIVDEIITNRPYFKNPYLYIHKIHCVKQGLLKKWKKDKTCKNPQGKLFDSKIYRKAVKENLDNYLFSYYINVSKPTPNSGWKEWYGEEEVVFELLNYYPHRDEWKLIRLLKMLFERDVDEKIYLLGSGDTCDNILDRLLCVYYQHGEDKNELKQLESQYYTYSGLKKYHANYPLQDEYALKEYEESKDDFEKALHYEPNNPMANYGFGKLLYEVEKNSKKAFEHLHKAEANFIFIWDAYYYLGKIYVEKKDYEQAKNYYKYALSLYDETGQDELIAEMVEDLSLIGGCRQELLEALEQKSIPDEKSLSPSMKLFKANEHFLDDKTKAGCESHIKLFKEEFFSSLWDKLDDQSCQLVSCAEKAYYCGLKSIEYFRPSFANGYLYYFQSLENEVLAKIFLPFKMEEWSKASSEEKGLLNKLWFDSFKEKDKRKADSMRKLVQFLSDEAALRKKIERPTLGQMLGMISLDSKDNLVVKKVIDFILYKSPLLFEKKYFDELDSIKEDRNKIHSLIDIEKSFDSHFQHFRDVIIGMKDKKGLLVRFLESIDFK